MSDMIAPNTAMAMMHTSQSDTGRSLDRLKAAMGEQDIKKAEEAAREFEAVFVAEMMKPMFAGLKTEAPFGGGKGEEVFRSVLLQEYGKLISQTGSIGLADQVKQEIINMQAKADGAQEVSP